MRMHIFHNGPDVQANGTLSFVRLFLRSHWLVFISLHVHLLHGNILNSNIFNENVKRLCFETKFNWRKTFRDCIVWDGSYFNDAGLPPPILANR